MRHRSQRHLFPESEDPREKVYSWRRILISDSDTPLNISLDLPQWHGPFPKSSTSQLTGQVTLGDVIAEAKKLAEEAFKHRDEPNRLGHNIWDLVSDDEGSE